MEVITMDTQPSPSRNFVNQTYSLSLRVSGWNILSRILGYFARDKY